MTEDSHPRGWWMVGSVGIFGLVALAVFAPNQVFGIPTGRFQMLFMTAFCFGLALVTFFDSQPVRSLGLLIMAIGFLVRAGEMLIGPEISLGTGLACIVIGVCILTFGAGIATSRASPSR